VGALVGTSVDSRSTPQPMAAPAWSYTTSVWPRMGLSCSVTSTLVVAAPLLLDVHFVASLGLKGVGARVGASVGASVGVSVGASVGVSVGLNVGLNVG
jgi:hypothetical protein